MELQHTEVRQAHRTFNRIYLRRTQKLIVPASVSTVTHQVAAPGLLAALLKHMERLGYTFSPDLLTAAKTWETQTVIEWHEIVMETLKQMLGDHVPYKPMYPNFPTQVMEASDAELYLRALLHYVTGILPETPVRLRSQLRIRKALKQIEASSKQDYMTMIRNLISANTSLSAQDKQDIADSLRLFSTAELAAVLPESIPYKENAAFVASILMEEGLADLSTLSKYLVTSKDVLRLAAGLSGLDTSLAWAKKTNVSAYIGENPYNWTQRISVEPESTADKPVPPYRFRKFKRAERRLLLALLEQSKPSIEDMVLYRETWKRLGEILHPGEMRVRYPKAFEAFTRLRRQKPISTFRSEVEQGIQWQVPEVIDLLACRPGELARRLDLLIRSQPSQSEHIIAQFRQVADHVAVPLLLQLLAHFKYRNDSRKYRVFFPKGNLGKVVAIYNHLPKLAPSMIHSLVQVIEQKLVARFAERESLGKVYIDPRLNDIPVPFSNRSASAALRPLPRGSRIAVPEGDILRLFCWWKNIENDSTHQQRVDIDLSLVLLDKQWKHVETLAFYNLKEDFGVHSGDITDAPKGAAEFIDLNIPAVLEQTKARYAMVQVACFTGQTFASLPECFAGFMMRPNGKSGEIYDPCTVESKFDLTAEAQQAVPFAIDLRENQMVWMDSAVKNRGLNITAHDNMSGLELLGRAFADTRRTSLGDLYTLHAKARGTQVYDPEQADTIFGMETGITPYLTDIIASEYL
ncbi:cytoplasmic protein [Saccharibacillus sp. JS10]|uniref:cytoplasmic protein n=1 Tax=Saccharibacillus sp. JS10 TaxID=2950552 RepID=UPI00210F1BC3|nr:cytoplasmic protein [Saccharibacillus sp. JS10]MCQ4085539.1 cytoplasmic protein [Saccharibacillus sp. JS10]